MKKKITKWEPENFELEMTTHWIYIKVMQEIYTLCQMEVLILESGNIKIGSYGHTVF